MVIKFINPYLYVKYRVNEKSDKIENFVFIDRFLFMSGVHTLMAFRSL